MFATKSFSVGGSRLSALSLAPLLLMLPFTSTTPCLGQPSVAPDGRVTFRLTAPGAKEVKLHCETVPDTLLQKDAQGVWTFTTQPLEPDIYTYTFEVDGLRTLDPNNPFQKYNLLGYSSQVHVPGSSNLTWELNDVPRGQVHRHFYKSQVGGDNRDFYVYTPPGYDPKAAQRYPVLYLLHGYSDDASAWISVGQANVILDNLIARGQAKPMIVVMPLGYGTMEVIQGGWSKIHDANLWQRNIEQFRVALLTEVMPQVEKSYLVLPEAANRAIAGLSMGGAESLQTGLNNLDKFGWIGAFSSALWGADYSGQFPALTDKSNSQLRLLWIACGKQDGLFGGNQQFCAWLQSRKVRYTWVETPGDHNFRVWRRNLSAFAPLLFQDTKSAQVR